jgi:predicted RND superfamily exporter protein
VVDEVAFEEDLTYREIVNALLAAAGTESTGFCALAFENVDPPALHDQNH